MGKRIFVLGGTGLAGSEVTRGLLSADDISEVVIGVRDQTRAKKFATELGDERVRVEYVDATNENEAVKKVRGYDVLVNCTLFTFFDNIIRIAIKAGVDYVDLLSEPTEKHYSMVKDAGITAIRNLGLSPGFSNIFAKKGAMLMDSTEEINIHWAAFFPIAPSPGLLDSLLWELGPEVPTRQYYLNGRFIQVPPLQGSKTVKFSEPIGEQVVYFMPHPETVSLARNIPGVKFVAVRGCFRPEDIQVITVLNRCGLLDDVDVEYNGQKINALGFTSKRLWEVFGGKAPEGLWAMFINVEVIGRKNGNLRTVTYNADHPYEWKEKALALMTGIPASVGVILLARRGRVKTGLIDPEEYYDPEEFLQELNTRGMIKVTEEIVDKPLG